MAGIMITKTKWTFTNVAMMALQQRIKTKKIMTGLHHDKNNLIATVNNDVKLNEYSKWFSWQ